MKAQTNPRSLNSSQILWCSAAIGAVGGLLATLYYALLQGLLTLIWPGMLHLRLDSLTLSPRFAPKIFLVTSFGGLLVGVLTRWLGSAGEIAAVVDNIHMEAGRIDMQQTPAMVSTSLVSIVAGRSAGPEAPLVQIIGSFGSWLGERMNLTGAMVRTFTFCGMGAALGAFFGAPLGGALFALEIPHRRGIEYYEALLPAIVSSMVAFVVFRSIVGYEPVIFHVPAGGLTVVAVMWGIGFGVVGALVAALFAVIFSGIGEAMHKLHHRPVLLGVLGGMMIGLLAQLSPLSLFWSELQMDLVIRGPAAATHRATGKLLALLLLLAGVKMISISATLHSGFRGGFIFPLMFIGATVGTAISVAFPVVPASVAIIAMMAGVNVAITKTPISTSVLLATLTGTSMTPVIIAASLTSLLLSSRLNLIRTQRSREIKSPGAAISGDLK